MAMWFSPNHRTEFSDIGTIFRDCFWVEFEDCFIAKFIVINDSLEIC